MIYNDGVQSPLPFGSLLRHYRLLAELTQAGLAERAVLSTRAIQHLEAGRGHPYADTTRRLADALGLTGDSRANFVACARRAPSPRGARSQPSLGPDARARHNLPVALTSFVGRDRELGELREELTTARLLTLFGVGGGGKTRLAVELARDVLERYPDGVWLVELAPLEAALVPRQVASVLSVAEVPGQSIVDVLIGALRDRHVLLVLDNCEHVARACADLADTLLRACPRVHILATSRSVLGVAGETIWQVPPLGVPAERWGRPARDLMQFGAARLFVERAHAAAPAFALTDQNAGAVARVCWRLDGIPLALELAAARVRTVGVAELANRLDDCFRLLVGGGPDRPARHQTLRATVDWSYDLLTPAEREVFVRLSVFAGGCTLEALEAVCASGEAVGMAVVDVLEQLVDKSLVVAEPRADGSMRLRLLETLRQYARERLEFFKTGAAEEACARHAAYFVEVLARWWRPAWWGPNADGRLTRVEQELDNLRAALRWLISARRVEPALQLGWALAPFWLLSARVGEGRAWMADLTALPDTGTPPSAARAGVQVWAGALATQDAEHATGREALERGLSLARASGDNLALSFALLWLALSSQYRLEPALARAYAEEGVAVSRAGRDRGLEGMNLHVLAQAALEAGDLTRAARLAEESLAACREAGHPPGIAWALTALGQVQFRRGAHAAARDLLQESLGQGQAMGAPAIRLNTLVYLAWTLLEQDDLVGASARGVDALELARGVLGGRSFLAAPLEAMAQVAVAVDQVELALRLAGAAAALRESGAAPPTPTQREQLARWLRKTPADGDRATSAAWIHGRALSVDEAIAQAQTLQTSLARTVSKPRVLGARTKLVHSA